MPRFMPFSRVLPVQVAFGLLLGSAFARAQGTPFAPQEVDSTAAAKVATPLSTEAFAGRVLAIASAIEANHIQPPPPTKVMAAGWKALYEAAKQSPPENLDTSAADTRDAAGLIAQFDPILKKADGPARAKQQQAFLKGMASAVPGGFSLVEAPSRKEMAVQEQVAANRYVGIGIMLQVNKKAARPEIGSAMLHGAARNAGIKAGDLIESVDGKDTASKPLAEIVDWLRGPEGSSVTVKVRHLDAKESRTYKMVRAKIAFEHVYGLRRVGEEDFDFKADAEAPIAYVRVGSYSSSTLHEMRQFERKLRAAGYRAIVLDLRSTGGGSLQHAALLGGGLLNGGKLWTIKQKNDPAPREFKAEQEYLFRDWPMVALIGGGMDLATGLIAAALQDSGRAKLVGETIPVDGYIRSIIDLPGQDVALMLPATTVERPNAATGWPVKPDYAVKLTPEQRKAVREFERVQEISDSSRDPKAPLPTDPQLAKATELLRLALEKTKVTKK
jgi:carboxyl-terminal processing protease